MDSSSGAREIERGQPTAGLCLCSGGAAAGLPAGAPRSNDHQHRTRAANNLIFRRRNFGGINHALMTKQQVSSLSPSAGSSNSNSNLSLEWFPRRGSSFGRVRIEPPVCFLGGQPMESVRLPVSLCGWHSLRAGRKGGGKGKAARGRRRDTPPPEPENVNANANVNSSASQRR